MGVFLGFHEAIPGLQILPPSPPLKNPCPVASHPMQVASFWQHSLGWQIFFACMSATLTLNLLRSAGKALLHSGVFGWFNEDVVFEAGLEVSAHVLAVLPAAAVGALAGVAGGLFTMLNLRVCRARDALLGHGKWRRCIEPCVLVVIYVTGTMVLPLFFPCTPTKCVIHQGEVYCDVQARGSGTGGTGGGGEAGGGTNGTGPAIGPESQPLSLPLYTCSIRAPDGSADKSWIPDSGTITPDTPTVNASTVYYNELATLLLNTGGWGGGVGRWVTAVVVVGERAGGRKGGEGRVANTGGYGVCCAECSRCRARAVCVA